jgi:hypothetical protein
MLEAIVSRVKKTIVSDRAMFSRAELHISSEASITSAVRCRRMSRVTEFGIAHLPP